MATVITREEVLSAGRAIEASFPPGLTNRRRGYTSFRGGMRLYAKLRQLDTDAEFDHIVRSFGRLSHLPFFDQNLILAIAFRESATLVLGSGTGRVDTFEQGGLDRLFREAARLERQSLLPSDVRRSLLPGSTAETEGSTAARQRRAAAALIPQRDLLVAYGAVVADRFNRFQQTASSLGLSLAGMDRRSTRIWTALFFGGPGGLDYEAFARQRRRHAAESGWMGSHLGARTVMTFLLGAGLRAQDIRRIDEHEASLYGTTRVISAFIVTAEAELLEALRVLARR